MEHARRWVNRPPGSNWGDFGEQDEIGRMNLITEEARLAAVRTVTCGKTFCLSLPLGLPGGAALNPRRRPPRLFATERSGRQNYNYVLAHDHPQATDVICDDLVLLYTQYSTQWDSLAHYGSLFDADGTGAVKPVYYNGWASETDIHGARAAGPAGDTELRYPGVGANRLGIDKLAETGVQGRGVLVNLERYWGKPDRHIDGARLMALMREQRVEIRKGDLLCLYTGFSDWLTKQPGNRDVRELHALCPALDGRDEALLTWLTESNISALIADNYAVEAVDDSVPSAPGARMPLHEHCLFKLGMNLGELWYLKDLAKWLEEHERHAFLLTAPPLRLPGAVGSPATPVATV
jgi:kynurenine formamidase